jgi:hypothetical protein
MGADLAIVDNYKLPNISFPALSTVNGGILLWGDFNQYDLLLGALHTYLVYIQRIQLTRYTGSIYLHSKLHHMSEWSLPEISAAQH